MKNELFKNLIVRKIFREMSDVSVIFQFFLVLLSAAIDLLNNSFFFVPNFCSNKMTLCESLFNKDSREPFMIFCLESIYKHANITTPLIYPATAGQSRSEGTPFPTSPMPLLCHFELAPSSSLSSLRDMLAIA